VERRVKKKEKSNVQIVGNEVVIENPPHDTEIEVCDAQNKRIYLGNSEHLKTMKIPLNAEGEIPEGTYIIKIGQEISLSRQFWKTPAHK
jgi:hypothetical protein